MSRLRLLTIAILLGLLAAFSVLYFRESRSSSPAKGRPAAGLTGKTPSGPSTGSTLAGPFRPHATTPAATGKHPKPDPSKLPGPELEMPKTAEGFVALLKTLIALNPMETDEGQALMERVGYAFHALLKENAAERAIALQLFRTESQPLLLEVMSLVFGNLQEAPEVERTMEEIARHDSLPERRRHALSAVGFYQSLASIPVALEVLRGETDPALRVKAIEAMPDAPPEGTTPAQRAEVNACMVDLSRAADPYVRGASFYILGEWGDPQHVPVLVNALNDPVMPVRAAAAFNLVHLLPKSPKAKEALLRVLRNNAEDPQVRGSAADALKLRQNQDPEIMEAVHDFFAWEALNRTSPH